MPNPCLERWKTGASRDDTASSENKARPGGPAPSRLNAALLASRLKFRMCLATGCFASNYERHLEYRVNAILDRWCIVLLSVALLGHLGVTRGAIVAWTGGQLPLRSPLVNSHHTIQTDCPPLKLTQLLIFAPRDPTEIDGRSMFLTSSGNR
jgi:hypothetical protein